MVNTDILVVGAGISGITAARILAEKGKKVLLIEKKSVIGGACRDEFSEEGINIHLYGPHIFRTSNKFVFDFVSRFAKFSNYQHRVTSYVLGNYCEFPINLNTLNKLFNKHTVGNVLDKLRNFSTEGENFEEILKNKIGDDLYSLFYKNYSIKQWLTEPFNLIPQTAAIIPIRESIDGRYFSDTYQGIPEKGYFYMLNQMLAHNNIKVLLNTDYKEIRNHVSYNWLVFTGRLDDFFDKSEGELEYHSVRFELEKTYGTTLPSAVVNYPNDYDYIRRTDYNYFMESDFKVHIIGTEYSLKEGEPLYAVPDFKNQIIKERYDKLVSELPENIKLIGRLATYKNLSMGQCVYEAIKICEGVQ
ncbi:MAG: FAD-dependent oxidoreductase [Clostridia bacterium]|nr:FAD-dependent oxidoreductase [Clostridia bacterium]